MEELSFLRGHVPTRTSNRIIKTSKNIDNIAKNMLIRRRTAAILLTSEQKLKEKQHESSIKEIIRNLNDPKDPFTLFSPIQVQTFSFLLEFLHTQLDYFSENIDIIANQPLFEYISYIGFPALFCYFSNDDICSIASDFYIKASKHLDIDKYTILTSTFFSTDSIWPFSRFVFNNFLWDVYAKKASLKTCIDEVFQLCADNSKLLPKLHLKVLKNFKEIWGIQKFWEFFANILIIPQIKLHLLTSPFSRANQTINSEEISDLITKRVKEGLSIDIQLDTSYCTFLPAPVQEGEPFAQTTILTTFDIRLFLSLPVFFPGHLQGINILSNDNQFEPFTVKIFIKRVHPIELNPFVFPKKPEKEAIEDPDLCSRWTKIRSELSDPVDFLLTFRKDDKSLSPRVKIAFSGENGDKLLKYSIDNEIEKYDVMAQAFELMLDYRLVLEAYYSWNEKSLDYLNFISLVYSINNFEAPKESMPELRNIYFWNTILDFSAKEKQLCDTDEYSEEEKKFKQLLDSLKRKFAPGFLVKSVKVGVYIWKISGLLNSVNEESSMLDKFLVISLFMKMVKQLSLCVIDKKSQYNNESLIIHYFIVVYDAKWIYSTALFLQKHVFGSQDYQIPFRESEQWNCFFTSFLNLVSYMESVLSSFTSRI